MKGKNLILVSVIALALIMTSFMNVSARGEEVEESIVGYYKVIRMFADGEDMSSEIEQLNALGGGIFLIIHEDNTGEVNMMGEISPIEIDDDYIIVLNEDPDESEKVPYTFEDGNIIMAKDSEEMEFTRMSDDEIESFKNGDYDKSIDDLIGMLDDSGSTESYEDESEENIEFDESYLPDLSDSTHEDAGYFEIMAFSEDDTAYTADQLSDAGVIFDMMLCPDGTGFAHFIGTYYDLSWEDGTIYVATDDGQEKMEYTADEDDGIKTITISDSNIAMIFEYVNDADSTYEWMGNSGVAN